MWFNLLFIPSPFDTAHNSLAAIFTIVPRITAAGLVAYLISQVIDIYIFQKLKQKYNTLWISKNGSTIVGQLIDTLIFVSLAYWGMLPFNELAILALTTYAFKFILSISDTGFIYIAKNIKQKEIAKTQLEDSTKTP